jgi:hypothetical protein
VVGIGYQDGGIQEIPNDAFARAQNQKDQSRGQGRTAAAVQRGGPIRCAAHCSNRRAMSAPQRGQRRRKHGRPG